jgi:hypothetical protein
MNRLQKITALLLLTAVAYLVSPKELIHNFFHAHETEDVICLDGSETSVSNLHQHCDYLQQSIPPLYHFPGTYNTLAESISFLKYSEHTLAYKYVSQRFLFLRGPPTC